MSKSRKFVILAGPTATGKTQLAIQLAQVFPFRLISADSRQVFRQADIVPGKDHPPFIDIAGVDICSPCQESSVALWFKAIKPIAQSAWQHHQLPLFVGGTGFYLKTLTSNIETIAIPPNFKLRTQLSQASVSQLQSQLNQLDPHKFSQLNQSDRRNPRRLLRAIEIALYRQSHSSLPQIDNPFLTADYLFFVLQPAKQFCHLIKKRVIQRLNQGAIAETKTLLQLCSRQAPVFQSLGYPSILAYLDGKLTYSQLIEDWTTQECRYLKRQLTWFKKQANAIFLPSTSPTLFRDIVKYLQTWYDNTNI